jgi:hypothetical protein
MTIVHLLDGFFKVEKVGKESFCFTICGKHVYILRDNSVPSSQKGTELFNTLPDFEFKDSVNVTKFVGNTQKMTVGDIELTSDPIFIWQ